VKHLKANQFSPGALWLLGLAFAVVSGLTSSPATLLILHLILVGIILLARDEAPWAQSLRFYILTGLLVIAIRVVFRIVFNFNTNTDVWMQLPNIELHFGELGTLQLLGNVSQTALMSALRDGLRMSAIILSIGMANTLANPRRLLKDTPGALYEVASAFVIALNLAPQLISSARRIREAQKLRGYGTQHRRLGRLLVSVLEDTLERSMALAASMDARGFGRQGDMTALQRFAARSSSLISVFSLAVGSYLLLTTANFWATGTCFVIGLAGIAATLKISSVKHVKTRFLTHPWRHRDSVLVALSFALMTTGILGGLG
jgi:energy-coupling factor transport system permease protein